MQRTRRDVAYKATQEVKLADVKKRLMESIESIGQKLNNSWYCSITVGTVREEGQKYIDKKFEKIWSKETDVLNIMIREINAGRDQVIDEYYNNILSEYRLLFKSEVQKTYIFRKYRFFLNYREFSKAMSNSDRS